MKVKFKRPKSVVSPWILIVGVLVVWVLGIFLGNVINIVTARFVVGEEDRNFWIVIIYVVASAIVGLALAILVTHISMQVINDINENVNKIAEGDFTARLAPITKNPHINSAVKNFNEMVDKLNSVAVLKNDFISNFTHEFKTPIASIKGYAELLDGTENLSDEQREYIRVIIEESTVLSSLAENTMKLAKLDSQTEIKKEEFFLDRQLEDCVLLFDNSLREKGIEIEISTLPAKIKSDSFLIREIWINLISNAIKFTNSGGKIKVSLSKSGNGYEVTVEDNGVGMSEQTVERVYEKFYQADKSHVDKGLGLGLSIVKRICELVGAEITCSSQLGKGTKMIVFIK